MTNNQDGTYQIKVPYGTTGTVDIEKDVLDAEDTTSFFLPESLLSDESPYGQLFARSAEETEESASQSDESAKVPTEIDFSAYKIDIRGDETDVWFPVTTLCDTFTTGTNSAFYLFDQ